MPATVPTSGMRQGGDDSRAGGGDRPGCLLARATAEPSPAPSTGDRFQFAVIGDYPYGADDVPKFDRLIDDGQRRDARRSSSTWATSATLACTDAALNTSLAVARPLHHAGRVHPGRQRVDRLRRGRRRPACSACRRVQADCSSPPTQSLGWRHPRPSPARAPEYPENARFDFGGVTFVAVHRVGSGNGTGRSAGGRRRGRRPDRRRRGVDPSRASRPAGPGTARGS